MTYISKFSKIDKPQRCRFGDCGSTKTVMLEEYDTDSEDVRQTFVCERHYNVIVQDLFDKGAKELND
jgi:hypothetical protein